MVFKELRRLWDQIGQSMEALWCVSVKGWSPVVCVSGILKMIESEAESMGQTKELGFCSESCTHTRRFISHLLTSIFPGVGITGELGVLLRN